MNIKNQLTATQSGLLFIKSVSAISVQ